MNSGRGLVLRWSVAVAALGLGCTDSTGVRAPAAVFVLRSLGGSVVPATVDLGPSRYAMVADTLFLAPPIAADGWGILRQAVTGAYPPALPVMQSSAHEFIWRDSNLLVFFDCQPDLLCPAIYTWRAGVLAGQELRFAAAGPYAPQRVYERIR